MKYGKFRVAAIYVDCPTPDCGGGVETDSGSFMLDVLTVPEQVIQATTWVCTECKNEFRIPAAAGRVLGVRR